MAMIKGNDQVLPGLQKLVQVLDTAVAGRSPAHAYAGVRAALPLLVGDTQVQLPAVAYRPHPQHYARHELYCSREHGYCVVAMAWAPGQGAPVHDHDGHWCVEAVWSGQLEVTDWQLLQADDTAGWQFAQGPSQGQRAGDCAGLQGTAAYHSVRNPDPQAVAVSVHVYQQRLEQCTVFTADGNGRYWPRALPLANDA